MTHRAGAAVGHSSDPGPGRTGHVRPCQSPVSRTAGLVLLALALLPLPCLSSVLAQQLPPVPEEGPSEILPEEPAARPPALPPVFRVAVKEIRVKGSTVFSAEEIAAVVQPYVNTEMTTEDLEELRQKLTALYTEEGYVNSGAFVPDQDVSDGILEIVLVEGILSEIDIAGNKWFLDWYFRSRIAQSVDRPLDIDPLRERLQLFLEDERIVRLTSELRPGLRLGEAALKVEVEEASPYQLFAEFNNFQSPTIGAPRGLGTFVHRNLLGVGDVFRFTYGRSEGLDLLVDTGYSLPVTPWDTTLIAEFRKNDFTVVEEPFDDLDIQSTTIITSIGIRQPVYRRLGKELALSVRGEYLENLGTIFQDVPFLPVAGSENGVANVAAIRFVQEWLDRTANQVIALRSRLSVGIDAFDATINEDDQTPSGEYFAWLGQGQLARRFDFLRLQLLARMDIQVANRPLFPLEQFPIGGRFTVRGYRENTLVRDNAFLFSVEPRIPLFAERLGGEYVQLAPFVDVGRGWQSEQRLVESVLEDTKTLASIGVGLRLSSPWGLSYNVYWGQQLNHVPDRGDTLQDDGVHMQFVWQIY